MKAAVYHGPGDVRLEDRTPRAVGPDDLLVRVKACGVCGTDVHIVAGDPGASAAEPPVVLGHEYAGEVVEVGRLVRGFKAGDRVTIDPNIYCGSCWYCRNGGFHFCENMQALGVSQDGGFAEYCTVPASHAYAFPDSLDYELGALTEPLACCVHGMDLAGMRAGQCVCILGGGAIGLMMLQLAILQGARSVALGEPLEKRRSLAVRLGAAFTFDPLRRSDVQKLGTEYPRGFDVVIECAGKPAAVAQTVALARRGATILLFSVCSPDAEVSLRPYEVFQKELTIRGSFVNPATHGRALGLIASGRVDLGSLITHRFPLKEAGKAIEMQTSPEAVKVLVKPEQ